jgi:hypothetical protein
LSWKKGFAAMVLVIECACGTVIEGVSEEGLIFAARRHIEERHRELGEPPSDEDLLAMSRSERESQPSTSGDARARRKRGT